MSVESTNHQPKACVRALPPRKVQRLEMSVKKSDVNRMENWELRSLQWMRVRREMGAGKRKAVSASVKRNPGVVEGITQARITIPKSSRALTAAMSGRVWVRASDEGSAARVWVAAVRAAAAVMRGALAAQAAAARVAVTVRVLLVLLTGVVAAAVQILVQVAEQVDFVQLLMQLVEAVH